MFEITSPGTWLNYEDREWSWRIERFLCHLQSQFFEANAVLNLFVQAYSVRRSRLNRALRERDAQRRSEMVVPFSRSAEWSEPLTADAVGCQWCGDAPRRRGNDPDAVR